MRFLWKLDQLDALRIPAASLRVRLKDSTALPSEDWVPIAHVDMTEIWISDPPFDAEAEYEKMQKSLGI